MNGRPSRGRVCIPLSVEVSPLRGGALVTVVGRLDAGTTPPLRDLLHRLIDTGADDVVLKLGQAEIGDGAALGVLLWAHHRARRAGRRLVLVEVTARTARVLRASHLDRVLLSRDGCAVAPLTASVDG